MTTFVVSMIVMVVVIGTLAGWAIREERRRARAEELDERLVR